MIIQDILPAIESRPVTAIPCTGRFPSSGHNFYPYGIKSIPLGFGGRVQQNRRFIFDVFPTAAIVEFHFRIGRLNVDRPAGDAKVVINGILIGVQARPIAAIARARRTPFARQDFFAHREKAATLRRSQDTIRLNGGRLRQVGCGRRRL